MRYSRNWGCVSKGTPVRQYPLFFLEHLVPSATWVVNLTTVISQMPFHLATWNVGGPQDSKWGEFVNGDTKDLNDAFDKLFQTPTSSPNTTSALAGFRRGRQLLLANLREFYPASFKENGACDIHNFWITLLEKQTVAQAFMRFKDKDPNRAYSWGDRHFPARPTLLSADPSLDLALFKSMSIHKPGARPSPHFRRFEDAWLDYMFRKTPSGNLVTPMPVNQYMVKDPTVLFSPSGIQVLGYLELFYFDWCIAFFVWCLESTAAYSSFWSVREAAVRESTPAVRRVHTAKFIVDLGRRCTAVALQEMSAAQIATLTVPPLGKLIMPDKPGEQMSCLLINDSLGLSGWNIFKDCWPETNPLSSRVAGCVLHIQDPALPKAIHGDWMLISAHCKPVDLDEIMKAMHTIRDEAFPGVTTMVLMGDLNWERAALKDLGQVCTQNGFVSTWNPFETIPDTVNNVRSKYFQSQQSKGGQVNRAPKDHVLVWNKDNLIPRTTTGVITSDEFETCEPDEPLYLTLPSDHAAVVVRMTPFN